MAKSKAPPKSLFSRTAEIAGLATRIVGKEISHRVSQQITKVVDDYAPEKLKHQIDQARQVVESLAKLKGAAMKAGQWIVLEGRDFFPPEVIKILSQLQDSGSFLDIKEIQEILKNELGEEKFSKIQELSDEPIASASIGQVHKAKIEGRDIVLKIQFPGISDSIDSDITAFKQLAKVMMTAGGKQADITPLMEELKKVLKQEVDYLKELKYLNLYRGRILKTTSYLVPEAFEFYSSSKVLTLEFMKAIRFSDWVESKPSKKDREHVGMLLIELYCLEFFDWGLVQTDPNPANFLVDINEKHPRLVILDFGATLEYSEDFKKNYTSLLRVFSRGNTKEIFEAAQGFGLIDQREDGETQELFAKLMRVSLEPFDLKLQPFNFSDLDYSERVRSVAIQFGRKVKYSAPPQQLIFLHRKLGGIFNIIKQLDVKIDLQPYWKKMLGLDQ